MTAQMRCHDETTGSGASATVRGPSGSDALDEPWLSAPLRVSAIAESAEVVIENMDAPLAAAPALIDGAAAVTHREVDAPAGTRQGSEPQGVLVSHSQVSRPISDGPTTAKGSGEAGAISIDEHAKAVLYNGLCHYDAARVAAERACERENFELLDSALAELVEASVRSGDLGSAAAALARLEVRAEATGSAWRMGLAACARALVCEDDDAEGSYQEAIALLSRTPARVALARVRLLYGEWLRRRGRRVDAREQLKVAHGIFEGARLGGFAERSLRELLATGETVRKRTDDTRLDLTAHEAHIAALAAGGYTNPEIAGRLFISPRTVEWHLRKVFIKLGIRSRRDLKSIIPPQVDLRDGQHMGLAALGALS